MSSSTVRVKEETRRILRELSEQTGEPMQEVLAKAVDAYWREWVLELTKAAYARLRAGPEGWQEELEERRSGMPRWQMDLRMDTTMTRVLVPAPARGEVG